MNDSYKIIIKWQQKQLEEQGRERDKARRFLVFILAGGCYAR